MYMKIKRIVSRALLLICLTSLCFGSIHFYYHAFYLPEKLFRESLAQPPADVIIVPGIPYGGGKWGFIMRYRVYWSVFLYKTGRAKNIIYSGAAVYTPYTEATIMALYAEKLGVPKEHIFTETKAEHTTENLYYSYLVAQQQGFKTIAFATDPFQSERITPYISKFRLNVTLLPMVIGTVNSIRMKEFRIESAKAYKLRFVPIGQRETPEQRDFYSRGGRIKTDRETK